MHDVNERGHERGPGPRGPDRHDQRLDAPQVPDTASPLPGADRGSRFKRVLRRVAMTLVGAVGLVVALGLFAAATLDAERYRTVLVDGVERATGHRVVIDGPLELSVSLTPELRASAVQVSNPAWEGAAPWLVADRIEARVGLLALLDGTLDVRRLSVAGSALSLETDADGRRTWVGPRARGARAGIGLDVRLQAITVDALSLRVRDHRSDRERHAAIDTLEIRAASADQLTLVAEGRYRNRPVSVRARFGRLRELLGGAPYPLSARVSTPGAEGTFEGSLESAFESPQLVGTVTAHLDDAAAWPALARIASGGGLELVTQVRTRRRELVLERFSLTAGDVRATGELAVAAAIARPAVVGRLAIDRLDLARWSRGVAGGQTRARPAGRVFPTTALRLGALRRLDAQIDLRIGEVAWEGTVLRDTSTMVSLQDGRLTVGPLESGFLGSRASGALSIDATGESPAVALELSAAAVPVGRLLAPLSQRTNIEGNGDLQVDLSSRGDSVAALMANLDGSLRLLMDSGRIRARKAEAIVAGLSGLFRSVDDGEWTELGCGAADLEITRGQVTPNLFVLDAERATVLGEGTIDLADEQLALKLTPYPKSFTLNLAVPVRVRGTLAEPRYAADEMAVARRVGAIALMAFPPTAIASLGTLALAGTATVGAGGAAGPGAEHPCLSLIEAAGDAPAGDARIADASADARQGEHPWAAPVPGAMVPTMSIGAVEN